MPRKVPFWLGMFPILSFAGLACAQPRPAADLLSQLKLPPGFSIDYFSRQVPGARSMALGPRGTLFVGTRQAGKVYALVDANRDGKAESVSVIAEGLTQPNGVAMRDGALYVAEVSRLLRFDDIEANLSPPPKPVTVKSDFPRAQQHGWKFIAFGPDGKLYIPVGAPCNACESEDPRFASITRMNPDGSGFEIFASGVRNTVGFDWHPQSGELWFTDNGRDRMGDDLPPDELNRASQGGMNFGFPYCHGPEIADPELGRKRKCGEFQAPVLALGPHVAALGMRFYTGSMFPPEYRNRIFIAEHGSWNRSKKIGYRLSQAWQGPDGSWNYQSFADGWLGPREEVRGRPVDVLVMPDGALLVSDDRTGAIYRITYASP